MIYFSENFPHDLSIHYVKELLIFIIEWNIQTVTSVVSNLQSKFCGPEISKWFTWQPWSITTNQTTSLVQVSSQYEFLWFGVCNLAWRWSQYFVCSFWLLLKKKFNSKIFAIINEKKTIKKLFMERTKLIIIVSLSNCKRNYRILLPLGSNGLEAYYKSIATNC